MTLDSRIMVLDPGVSPRECFDKMAELLGAPDTYQFSETPGNPLGDDYERRSQIGAAPMQGLPAWLIVYHWDGEQMPEHRHTKWCHEYLGKDENEEVKFSDKLECDEEDTPKKFRTPRGYVEISIDTAYGYQAENRAGCGDLHAWLIQEFGAWLDSKGIRWQWYDESGDGWQAPGTPVQKLGDPEAGRPGSDKFPAKRDERMLWFENAVKPAILSQLPPGAEVQW